jgi:hypothetical protein
LNFVQSMSPIWCPVTDEISPGGNTLWNELDLVWESCCQFCNDTKTDEDFPAALKRLEKRAADAFKLQGVHYVNDASSPVQGAIDLGGPPLDPVADAEPEFIPAWLEGKTLDATWSGGIGFITENRCVECHRPGGAAPMPLLTHGAMRKWSKNMKTHISQGTMPPWPATTDHSYLNGKNLTQKERDLFLEWIDAGFPPGDGKYAMEKEWGDWAIGTPDEVIQLEEYVLGENVADFAREFEVPTSFDSDKWVVAAEAIPTDTFLTLEINGGPLGSYHTGNSTVTLPEGYGYLIKKGEPVKVRIYYTKEAGWEEFDSETKFGLKFADSGADLKPVLTDRMGNDDFTIPAGSDSTTASSTFTFPSDGSILSVNPVVRMRGKSVKMTLTLPDGTEKVLVDIPRFDMNWHFNYTLVEPLEAPKGTVVTMTATYDNSEMNAANPDPTVDVKAGLGGELLEGWLTYTLDEMKSASNRFSLSDDELMAATGSCPKCEAAGGKATTATD